MAWNCTKKKKGKALFVCRQLIERCSLQSVGRRIPHRDCSFSFVERAFIGAVLGSVARTSDSADTISQQPSGGGVFMTEPGRRSGAKPDSKLA